MSKLANSSIQAVIDAQLRGLLTLKPVQFGTTKTADHRPVLAPFIALIRNECRIIPIGRALSAKYFQPYR